MSYWAEFADAGTPGRRRHGELPRWPPWGEGEIFLVLDTPAGGGIRMSSDVVTKASVLAEIDADPRQPTQRERWERFADLALHSQYVLHARGVPDGRRARLRRVSTRSGLAVTAGQGM